MNSASSVFRRDSILNVHTDRSKMVNETLVSSGPGAGATQWISESLKLSIITIISVAALMWIVRFIRYRQSYKSLTPLLPTPPFSILFGNLKAMAEIYAHAPTDTHPHGVMTMIQRKWNLKGMWFIDTWPATGERQLVIVDPDLAAQVTQTNSRPKHHAYVKYTAHITGPTSLLFTEGTEWKRNRSLFNPGFSLAHLTTLIPTIVDDTTIYCQVLRDHADSGEVRPIEDALAHLTIDIMGHVVLDHDLNSQTEQNELVEAFRKQISWTPSAVSTKPFVGFNPLRPFMQIYYGRKMNNYLEKVLDDRYANTGRQSSKSRRKPAIDLALDEYAVQQEQENVARSTQGIDKEFKSVAIDQMRTFLFAGHDTSSSTLAYVYLLLSQHPNELAKARAELDSVFGSDPSRTGELIKQNHNLTNNLPIILSIIKETLRLFPPAMTIRKGQGTITYEGVTYNIDGFMLLVTSHSMHRNPDYFPSPDKFIPERWIPGSDSYHEIPKDAFRPFEKGPRDCIGQQLALLEMKIILAMTLRDFDFEEDYKTWDRKLGREKPGDILDGRRGMFGQRYYQRLIASAKPVDGLPGRFIRRKNNA